MVSKHFESPWDDAQTWAVISTAPKVSETYPFLSPFGAFAVFKLELIQRPLPWEERGWYLWICFSPRYQEAHAGTGFPLMPVPPAEVGAHGQEGDKP